MPTRIVLNQTVGSVPKLFSREETPRNAHPPTSSEKPSVRSLRGPTYAGPSGNSGGSNSRPLPGFRSSILRELNVRGKNNSSLYATEERRMLAAARDDIRASPRLLGYLFSIIAGAVMLVSVVQ